VAGHSLGLNRDLGTAIEELGGRSAESFVDAYVTATRYRFDSDAASIR
jgi:hypothetical protein